MDCYIQDHRFIDSVHRLVFKNDKINKTLRCEDRSCRRKQVFNLLLHLERQNMDKIHSLITLKKKQLMLNVEIILIAKMQQLSKTQNFSQ
jgi:hypothetical protein